VRSNPQLGKLLRARRTKYIQCEPSVKQEAFLWLTSLEAFYGGAAGGGKSQALLMAALQYVDIPGYNALLVRDSFQNLNKPEGLIPRAHEWLQPTDAQWSGEKKQYTFPSGATLSFGYIDGPLDHFNYQSAAFQYIGIDEAVNIRENQALYLFSRLRKLKKYQSIPLRFRCASNPPTREQVVKGEWVKKRYVTPATRAEGVIFLPAWMDDNPHLDRDSYRDSLSKLDPITRRQLESGDWDIQIKGRMFDRSWFKIVDKAPIEGETVRYWDRAASLDEGAYTAGCKMTRSKNGQYYIESLVRFRKTALQNQQIIRQVADIDGKETPIWMEQEPGSSGVDTIDTYRRNVLPEFTFRADRVSGKGSKEVRAMPLASQAEAGNVFLVEGSWNKEFLDEIELFPDGKYKDQVDSCSGAFNKISGLKAENRIRTI
jgi:predicted phage terminase large subunit-like protein